MKEYKLKLLMVTTSGNSYNDEQYEEITVKADGYDIKGDGSVY